MKIRFAAFMRWHLAMLLCIGVTGFTGRAWASGDSGCYGLWRVVHYQYSGCSNMAFLSPSNDTRVNLLLLMADLRQARGGSARKGRSGGRMDAPLFLWEQLAERLGTPEDKVMVLGRDSPEQSGAAQAPELNDPFHQAVAADQTLRPEERDALLAARKAGHAGTAADAAIAGAEKAARTPAAKAYVFYLRAAALFWSGEYDKAATAFAALMNTPPGWVRETAAYMVGRTLIGRAQVGAFDEYGSFAQNWHADAKSVAMAETALDKYLQQYPKGVYARSARGLKRRGYWLAHDTSRLAEEYGALLLMSPDERNISDVALALEIDNKLNSPAGSEPLQNVWDEALVKGSKNPLLLAMLDLQAMRSREPAEAGPAGETSHGNPLSLVALEQQKPYFATQMALYEYLLAVHAFYIEHKPAAVLRMIPDAARQGSFTNLQFSRQMLRGAAIEAMKDRNALGFWKQMLSGATAPYQRAALELAIAYHDERTGEVRNAFAAESPVHDPYLREVLLANVADADLLRTQATNASAPKRERDIALFTLLYKEATRGRAAEFVKDVKLVPANAPTEGIYTLDDVVDSYFARDESYQPASIPLGVFLHDKTDAHFGCPGLRGSEEQLMKDANNPTALLCVADFVRLNDAVAPLVTSSTPADDLGGTPSLFPGGNFARMSAYMGALTNGKSSRNDKAFALYRAVNCYAPSGNNDCGGSEVPKSQRKAWFTTLKRDYAGTRWADELQYYW